MHTNRVPLPRPQFKAPPVRNLTFRPWARVGARPINIARANAPINRSYHVETAWEAMLLTSPYSGEKTTFKRWSNNPKP